MKSRRLIMKAALWFDHEAGAGWHAASVAVDYQVTQVVDGSKGIHGMIAKAIFTGK
jgi:acetamidase/formamidase